MKELLHAMTIGQTPEADDVRTVFQQLMAGEIDPIQAGSFLLLQVRNGIDAGQLSAALSAMMACATTISLKDTEAIDNCGTGGDGGRSFNVSTTAAFVIAGADQTVAKHGNRAVSSKCGSADLLESLGIKLDLTPDQVKTCIDEVGIGFMFAPLFHPAVKNVVPIRKALQVRTIFNMLGPLANPARVNRQLIGVYDEELTEIFGATLAEAGKRAFVVYGEDGADEVSLTTRTKVTEVKDGTFESHIFDPRRYGFNAAEPSDLEGGDLEQNQRIFEEILRDKQTGPKADLVILNAGFALHTSDRFENLDEAFEAARHSIQSGAAWGKVEALKKRSNSF